MLNTSENYEKAFQDCEKDLQQCSDNISENEEEIKRIEENNRLLNARKQDILELRSVLGRIIGETVTKVIEEPFDSSNEEPEDIETKTSQYFFTVKTSDGEIEVPDNAFECFDNVGEATAHLLKIVGSPLKHSQIADALLNGGYKTKSLLSFSENVRSALRSASQNSKREILWKDNCWQLADWTSNSSTIPHIPIITNEKTNRRGIKPKWGKSVGDAAEGILIEARKQLHLNAIHEKLFEMGIYPTFESLDSALRQDTRKRFKRVSPRTYKLLKKS